MAYGKLPRATPRTTRRTGGLGRPQSSPRERRAEQAEQAVG